jgi:hypothetical protein
MCLLSYNQLVTSYACLYKIAHVKHEVLCYMNKTWRSLCNVVRSLRTVEGNMQHLPTAMVLIVGILATVFFCYHFHTEYSIPPHPAFSAVVLIAMQIYNLISHI